MIYTILGADFTEEEMNHWLRTQKLIFAHHVGNGYDRMLYTSPRYTDWVVTDHDREIFRGPLEVAVYHFNQIKQHIS